MMLAVACRCYKTYLDRYTSKDAAHIYIYPVWTNFEWDISRAAVDVMLPVIGCVPDVPYVYGHQQIDMQQSDRYYTTRRFTLWVSRFLFLLCIRTTIYNSMGLLFIHRKQLPLNSSLFHFGILITCPIYWLSYIASLYIDSAAIYCCNTGYVWLMSTSDWCSLNIH